MTWGENGNIFPLVEVTSPHGGKAFVQFTMLLKSNCPDCKMSPGVQVEKRRGSSVSSATGGCKAGLNWETT